MRVRFLTHAYPRWDGDIAGSFIERLACGLRATGVAVDVVVPADGGQGGRDERHGVPITRARYAPSRWETLAYRGTMVEAARTLPGGLAALGMIGTFARAAGAGDVTCVHAHWWIPAGIGAWMRGLVGGAPYVVTLHGTDAALLGRSAPLRAVARRVLRGAGAITTVSRYLADRLAATLDIPRETIVVQPMPVDLDRYDRPAQGGAGLAVVGRLVAQKRVDLILDAVERLGPGAPPLTVIGDGPERPALEQRAGRLGSPVTFVGAVAPADLAQHLAGADVLAFAGRDEGLGLAVAEALLLGIPVVVTSDAGGAVELVDAHAGRVSAPTPDAIAEAITTVMGDTTMGAGARRAGEALRAAIGVDAAAATFADVYRRVAGGA